MRVKYNAHFICKIEASNKSIFNIVIAANMSHSKEPEF